MPSEAQEKVGELSLKNKWGKMEIKQLPTIILLLVLAAFILGIGLGILQQFRDSNALHREDTRTNYSASVTLANANVTLGNRYVTSITQIYNCTGDVLATTSYNLTSYLYGAVTDYTIFIADNSSACANVLYVDYKYTEWNTSQALGVYGVITSTDDLANDWFSIIVIAVGAAILIGLLTFWFRNNPDR